MSKEAVGLVMNVGYGKEITIKEVAKMVLESLSSSLEIELKDGYPGDFPRTLCDNSRARGTLGWRPTVDFKTGLKSELEWLKETKTNTVPSSMASRSS
jgi:nucleoside-diphosphate-sugar epimerase